jgi:hypothetical protein
MQMARRAALGLTSDNVTRLVESCEFISLGCCCAVSNSLQFLGLKRNSYPFDWVRSSLDGIMHCLDVEFEDFLTYSTYSVTDQYVIFGGTRWGGSFWHHNLEVPLTKQDMTRRVARFYGRENVPTSAPKLFVRGVNSTREINAALRFKQCLHNALPGQDVLLLLIVDLQAEESAMVLSTAHGVLVYGIAETETMYNMNQGADGFRLCSETYTRAVAFAVKYWAGEPTPMPVRTFGSMKQLSAACVQFDGGDPGRELFTPRKFYGQQMALSDVENYQSLLAQLQTQMFSLPQGFDVKLPFPVQCFGRNLQVVLPAGSQPGGILQLNLNGRSLTAAVSTVSNGALVAVGPAFVEELPVAIAAP